MITLLFHKYVLVPLWVLGSARGTAVMRTALALALPEPKAQGKVEGESPEWSGLGWGKPTELWVPRARPRARHSRRAREGFLKEWVRLLM